MGWFIYLLALIGAISLIALIIVATIGFSTARARNRISGNTILEIDFGNGLVETNPAGFINRFAGKGQLQIRDVVSSLEFAAKDRRIKGVIAHIGGGPFSYADVQEIRNSVIRFKDSGKPAFAFAETFGEGTQGNTAYYMATAFDSIFIQPSGELALTGILSQSQFLKGTLDKLDVGPEIDAREEYKAARNQFTETKYTAAHREMAQSIINSVREVFLSDIAEARGIDTAAFSKLIADGPFSAEDALKLNLVDALQYRDQVYNRIKESAGKKTRFLNLANYIKRIGIPRASGKTIALIYGNGTITQGRSRVNPLTGETVMGAQTIAAAFRAAIKDKNVGAIVFRVNSPGGSYIGSDMIWRETVRAKEAGKPLIVSMGSVAGSGGYFVSMSADKIIAQPSTITGSIGVVSGKFVTSGLYNKLGVTFDRVFTDSNATTYLSETSYTQEQWNYLQKTLDRTYKDFVTKVASGRNLTLENAYKIAKGRVYTGKVALAIGLVDTLGGFPEAFALAKKMIGLREDKPVRIKRFPKQKTFWEQIFGKPPENSDDAEIYTDENMSIIDNGLLNRILEGLEMPALQNRLLLDTPIIR